MICSTKKEVARNDMPLVKRTGKINKKDEIGQTQPMKRKRNMAMSAFSLN